MPKAEWQRRETHQVGGAQHVAVENHLWRPTLHEFKHGRVAGIDDHRERGEDHVLQALMPPLTVVSRCDGGVVWTSLPSPLISC